MRESSSKWAALPARPSVVEHRHHPRVQAQLVALAPQGMAPGQPLKLGLRIKHQPDWHTYWKNQGDSGLPTQLDWQLPPACRLQRLTGPRRSKSVWRRAQLRL